MLSPALMAELIAGGVFSVIRARILEGNGHDTPLVELAPSFVAFILAPYIGQTVTRAELAGHSAAAEGCSRTAELPTAQLPLRLPIQVTYRTTLVLRAIARVPLSSNREIAQAAGMTDEGQTSHLLRRLGRRGLIAHVTPQSGSRRKKAWLLTPCGRRVIEPLSFGGPSAATHPLPKQRGGQGGMTSELAHVRAETARYSHKAGARAIRPTARRRRATRAGSPSIKRASVGGLLVPASMTRAHSLVGRWSRCGRAIAVERRGGSLGGETVRRSLITLKRTEGVME
jgi:hypothetical protein